VGLDIRHRGGSKREVPPGARHQGVGRGEAIAIIVALSQGGAIDGDRIAEELPSAARRWNPAAAKTPADAIVAQEEPQPEYSMLFL
jgi:hypothetical protein